MTMPGLLHTAETLIDTEALARYFQEPAEP